MRAAALCLDRGDVPTVEIELKQAFIVQCGADLGTEQMRLTAGKLFRGKCL